MVTTFYSLSQDQTVVTLAVMDASVTDHPEGESVRKLLALTVPHSIVS